MSDWGSDVCTSDRLGAGGAVGGGDAHALPLGQLILQLTARVGEREEALAADAQAGTLGDEALTDELAQHPRQRLLGDAQDGQQFRDSDAGVASDEEDDPEVRPADAVVDQDIVVLAGEVAASE